MAPPLKKDPWLPHENILEKNLPENKDRCHNQTSFFVFQEITRLQKQISWNPDEDFFLKNTFFLDKNNEIPN